jgi:hypothetical protein
LFITYTQSVLAISNNSNVDEYVNVHDVYTQTIHTPTGITIIYEYIIYKVIINNDERYTSGIE